MSESYLYRLSQRLRLLAREGLDLAQDGRVLRGELHHEVELARHKLEQMLDQVLDGHPLGPLQQSHVAYCQQLVEANKPRIRQLELAYA